MTELFKRLIQVEGIFEQLRDENPQFETFYSGYLKGLKDVKWIVLNMMKDNK